MLRHLFNCAVSASIALIAATSDSQIYYPMQNTSGSEFVVLTSGDVDPGTPLNDPDVTIAYGINYATYSVGFGVPAGIPEAPNTRPGDTPRTGMFVSANDNLITNISGLSEIALLPKDTSTGQLLSLTGAYEVQVDIWMNYDKQSANATEFGGLLVGHDGLTQGRLTGGGLIYSGDSGALSDFRLQHGPASGVGEANNGGVGFIRIAGEDDGMGGLLNGDGYYNPDVATDYFADVQFDADFGVAAALDSENDFWQEIAGDRTDLGASLSPYNSQGVGQAGPPTVNNPPGDMGMRWGTIRIEVDPNEMGTGPRAAAGVARVYLSATWQVDGDDDLNTFDPVTITGPEKLVGTISNSLTGPDVAGNQTAVLDFSDPIAMIYADLFVSFEGSGYNFAIFDNLIVTPATVSAQPGDFNGDGKVDNGDLNLLLGNWGSATVPVDWINGFDTPVDNGELNALLGNWGFGVSVAVPEPTALAMLAVGSLLMIPKRR
ncbi:hypothetical protein [Botrimarina hoheduenensis]|uniref:PEP-CTERM protein-sorting domain-containing protein n=1 Tax=Botrimarina hoheduenensis TaxID=2528000 RepID=A0A5C5VYB1_9BACT|nr:hypothetical protein [Botrimarina hoheduenensis]TWT43414.1 hypothetical protein Pla111_23650 [Botrimarina hoheduenensis]